MILLVGGAGQRLSQYARELLSSQAVVADGACCSVEEALAADLLTDLHLLLWREMLAGRDSAALSSQLTEGNTSIVTCAEVGCGVVPLDAHDRDWREAVGRACCLLAQRAERVERLVCGIPIIIKGDTQK